jgi:hypothetical protein
VSLKSSHVGSFTFSSSNDFLFMDRVADIFVRLSLNLATLSTLPYISQNAVLVTSDDSLLPALLAAA